jgi:hypothetical protein
MFVILVFAASSAICANIFGQAYNYSKESKDLTQAVLIAETQAEEFKANPEDKAGRTFTLCYDKDWEFIHEIGGPQFLRINKTGHFVEVKITTDGIIATCVIKVDEKLYELTAKKALAWQIGSPDSEENYVKFNN